MVIYASRKENEPDETYSRCTLARKRKEQIHGVLQPRRVRGNQRSIEMAKKSILHMHVRYQGENTVCEVREGACSSLRALGDQLEQ